MSADLSVQLRAEIERLPHEAWHFWEQEASGVVREWAEVPFVPSRIREKRDLQPYRYLALRVRTAQGVLFADGATVKHFAVVSNDWEMAGQDLLQWQRGKAGTVEQVHRVLKDELAAGVYPSGKFGANAAWFRLNVLTYNLLSALKRLTLPGDLRTARPKRLRFLLFNTVGKVVTHARRTLLRLSAALQHTLLVRVRRRITRLAPA